jgi:hypothetical protein
LAVGGRKQCIVAERHCQRTQFAADQPVAGGEIQRFTNLSPAPSIRTLSYNTPEAQHSSGPLSSKASAA